MKAYLLTYNTVLQPERVHQMLNTTQAVQTWVAPFPYTAIVLSRLTVNELAAVLQTHFAGVWFIITEANKDNTNGWLPENFWNYVTDPDSAWTNRLFNTVLPPLPPRLPLSPLAPPPKVLPALGSIADLLGKKKP